MVMGLSDYAPEAADVYADPVPDHIRIRDRRVVGELIDAIDSGGSRMRSIGRASCEAEYVPDLEVLFDMSDGSGMSHRATLITNTGWMIEIRVSGGSEGDRAFLLETGCVGRIEEIMPDGNSSDEALAAARRLLSTFAMHLEHARSDDTSVLEEFEMITRDATVIACLAEPPAGEEDLLVVRHRTPWHHAQTFEYESARDLSGQIATNIGNTLLRTMVSVHSGAQEDTLHVTAVTTVIKTPDVITRLRVLATGAHAPTLIA